MLHVPHYTEFSIRLFHGCLLPTNSLLGHAFTHSSAPNQERGRHGTLVTLNWAMDNERESMVTWQIVLIRPYTLVLLSDQFGVFEEVQKVASLSSPSNYIWVPFKAKLLCQFLDFTTRIQSISPKTGPLARRNPSKRSVFKWNSLYNPCPLVNCQFKKKKPARFTGITHFSCKSFLTQSNLVSDPTRVVFRLWHAAFWNIQKKKKKKSIFLTIIVTINLPRFLSHFSTLI